MTDRLTPHDAEVPEMNTVPYERAAEDWEDDEDERSFGLPRRPRRQLLNARSAALIALIVGAAGFYGGVRVEKGQLSTSGTTATRAAGTPGSGAASRFGAGAAARFGGGGVGARTGGGLAAGAPGAGNADFGTVTSVGRRTLYLTDPSGNTVKVSLSSATKVSKSQSVSRQAIRPGDTAVIQGVKNGSGTLAASSVTDSGASAAGGGRSGQGGSSSSASSAVSSLFGSGAGG